MSDSNKSDPFKQERDGQSELLNELDSLKALLNEEVDNTIPAVNSVSEIRSVKEYMLLKQEADKAGVSLDNYLVQRGGDAGKMKPGQTDEAIPMLDEVVPFQHTSHRSGNVGTASQPLPQSATPSAQPKATLRNLEEVEQLVQRIVEKKLQEIRPQLEKQVFDQIRNMLPIDLLK